MKNDASTNNSASTTSDYILTDKAEGGVEVRLKSKTPFAMNFPPTLGSPIIISLADNHTIEISQKDGMNFATLPKDKNQEIRTASNFKLLDVIQKDPNISTYRSGSGNLAFYAYQKIVGEQKQSLFKNWMLFNAPTLGTSGSEKLEYEIKNAIVNIDSSGEAEVFFDDGQGAKSRPSDFIIPKPYFLDKDANRTDLSWQFDQSSHTLAVSFMAGREQYPIALDPSVLKTDTVIATFSGKTIAMKAVCGASLTCGNPCIYNGDSYSTVLIGAQCWMKENMMTTKYPDGTNITRGPTGATWDNTDHGYYAYPPNIGNTAEESLANIQAGKLGFVYQWSAAMHGVTTAGAQGLCPSSWHVPTHDEYTTLERAVCTSGTCATDFPFDTTTTGWRGTNEGSKLSTETSGGTNSSGFTAHLAGYRFTGGSFNGRSSSTDFWSSLPSGGNAWYRNLSSGNAAVSRTTGNKANGFSVRCLKN